MAADHDSQEPQGMRDIVGASKENAISAGLVKDAAAQSLSALAENKDALGKREGGKAASKAKRGQKAGRADIGREAKKATSIASSEGVARIAPLKLKQIAGRKAAQELDEAEELEGCEVLYDTALSTKRALRTRKDAQNTKAKGAQDVAEKGIGSRKRTSAAGSKATSSKAKGASAQASGARAAQAPASAGAATASTSAKSATTAVAGSIGGSGAVTIGGVLCGIIAFVLCALVIGQMISALFGFWQNEANKQSVEGLPPYITYEMVEEAIACQEEYGHPAGCTIAQIICESGQGETMSQLATRDHNLFGMKWASSFASAPEVAGKAGWSTKEEYTPGEIMTITAYFTVFKGDVECIRFRSRVFLQASHYRNNALIQEAITTKSSDKMAEGLKDAGWATSSDYVDSLKSVMDIYGLRRFDGMSLEDFRAGGASGDAIVAAARTQLGVPYVWGGTTPNVGLDCSGFTQYCYRQAGISIPRNSEDQYRSAKAKVPVSQAVIGDILYRPGHVAIYIGNDQYIHEPHSGGVCSIATGASYFQCALKYR